MTEGRRKMEASKKARVYSCISAALFIVLAVFYPITHFASSKPVPIGFSALMFVISAASFIALAVVVLLRKRKAAVVASCIYAMIETACIFFSDEEVFFARAFFFVFGAFSIIFVENRMQSGSRIAKNLWFLPAALMVIGTTIACFNLPPEYIVLYVIVDAADVIAFLFIGLWYRAEYSIPSNIVVTPEEEPEEKEDNNSPKIGDAGKLLMYKDLLDSGAITQEEFDQKKQQILGHK